MQRKSLRLIAMMLIVIASLTAKANPVDMRTAREVAMKFVNANTSVPLRGAEDLQLVTTYNISRGDAAFHIFNTSNGFVIVAADDCATPILGYSDEGKPFAMDNVPIQLQGYLQGFVEQIEYGIENNIQPDEATAQQWELVRTIGRLNNNRDGEAVEPLITTQWNQGWPYNARCPIDSLAGASYHYRCPTGCTATATAQIVNYWRYPIKGVGYCTYGSSHGFLTASFNETYYQWDMMDVNHIEVISTLLYQLGISMKMDYKYNASGAYLSDALDGLQRYFDYSTSAYYRKRELFADDYWKWMIETNLVNGKPILYEGYYGSNLVGHAWVVDGFDNNDLFHMNFGWGGNGDGFYTFNSVMGFNTNQGAVFGLCPSNSPLVASYETEPIEPLTYCFHDFSTGSPTEYEWSFGDGGSSNLTNPIHVFDTSGVYHITMIVSNGTERDTVSSMVTIENKLLFPADVHLSWTNAITPPIPLDFNLDGQMDFFRAGCYSNRILYMLDGARYTPIALESPLSQMVDEWGVPMVVDIYHENRPSLLKSGYFLYNTGETLTFCSLNFMEDEDVWDKGLRSGIYGNSVWCKETIIGDIDGDGEDDMVLGGYLYRNVGHGLYRKISNEHFNITHIIDIDGDGDLDLLGGEFCRNDGGWEFTKVTDFTNVPIPGGGAFADFDNDAAIDYAVGPYVWRNDGNGAFCLDSISYVTYSGDEYSYSTTSVLDINIDGASDVIVHKEFYDGTVTVNACLYGNAIGAMTLLDSFSVGIHSNAGCIDYDNNGKPDYLVVAQLGDALWENKCPISNNPPSIPQNLWTETNGNSVILHWDTVSDDHSHYGSITYNIMVGTSPNGYDIKSPLSNIETGKRYVYDKGNAGYAPLWKMNNLPNGTYYWRVQAIDNSLAASSFSASGMFEINGSNLNPEMGEITIQTSLNRTTLFDSQVLKDHYCDKEGDSIQGIIITSLPRYGSLFIGGNLVELNQQFSVDEIDSLSYMTSVFMKDTVYLKAFNQFGMSSDPTPVFFDTKLFKNTYSIEGVCGKVALGDYDNDGQMDFASTFGIYSNIGNGFERTSDSIPAAESVVWADINNDGLLDCLFDSRVLTNDGSGGFEWGDSIVQLYENSVAVGDANNDNKIDCFISGINISSSFYGGVYFNSGSGLNPDSVTIIEPGYRTGDASFGDFNNDGFQDIIAMGIINWTNTRKTNLYLNQNGTYTINPMEITGMNVGSAKWGDFDNDGDLDLLICGSKGTTRDIITSVFENYSGMLIKRDDLALSPIYKSLTPLYRGQALWFDYDNDGYLDIILSGISNYQLDMPMTMLYHNVGGNGFEIVHNTGLPYLSNTSIDVADIDNDGYEDVIISGRDINNNAYTGVFSNGLGDGIVQNNPSSAIPSNLTSTVNGSTVVLSWEGEPSSSYNFYVRDADGFVVSPMADVTDGFRKITSYGNAGHMTTYTLRRVPAGTYQWSVQKVSNSRAGSAFADEQTFTVTCDAEQLITVYDTVCSLYESEYAKYDHDGVYYEYYLGDDECDSIIERHITVLNCERIFVRSDSEYSSGGGYSWEHALPNLQKAFDIAKYGDQIWVAQGTYYGDGISDNAFTITDGVSVYGGFVGDEPDDYDLSLRDLASHPTILDGQNVQRTLSITGQWWHAGPLLDGFTIQNGHTSGWGGNISGDGSGVISNCVIRDGDAYIAGGAYRSKLINSIITNNNGGGWSGGIRDCTAINCLITGNQGVVSACEHSNLTNCILWHNVNNNGHNESTGNTFLYSAIECEQIEGDGNICIAHNNNGNSADSLYVRFVNPENNDYRLSFGSACLNTGIPDISGLGLPSVDLRGATRIKNGRIDIGPYEFGDTLAYYNIAVMADSIGNGSVTGSGTYLAGTMVQLKATPSSGQGFYCWTKGEGLIVSYSPTYAFMVTEEAEYVAHFVESEGVTIGSGSMTNNVLPVSNQPCSLTNQIYTASEIGSAGSITAIAFYKNGAGITRKITVYMAHTDRHSFTSASGWQQDWICVDESDLVFDGIVDFESDAWTTITLQTPFVYDGISNLVVVVDHNSIPCGIIPLEHMEFLVFETDEYQAIFIDGSTDWNPSSPQWGGRTTNVKNLITLYKNTECLNSYTISATSNSELGGLVNGNGQYIENTTCTLKAIANPGNAFLNWTKDGVVVSYDATYSFTVTASCCYTANFTSYIMVETPLAQGWTWWAPMVESSADDIEISLGNKLQQIQSQDNLPVGEIIPGQMYKIQTTEPCTLSLSGIPITSATLSIGPGCNWFGYISAQPSMINNICISPSPDEGDKIISQNDGFAIYEDYSWEGSLENLMPGYGYEYISNSIDNKTMIIGAEVAIEEVYNITHSSASFNCVVSASDGVAVTERGVCWSTNHNPTIIENNVNDGAGTGNYFINISGLSPNTTYYVRAYAIISSCIIYGMEVSFTSLNLPTGATSGLFSISATQQVYFSQGNLQYRASTNTWRFAENQWDYVGDASFGTVYENGNKSDNTLISATYDGWIDLFGWGTSGYDHGALCYQPYSTSSSYSDYYVYGENNYNLFDQTGEADWGQNAIANGGNTTNTWRTLTQEEWAYVLYTRNSNSGIRFAKAQVNNVNGLVLLPDDWNSDYYTLYSMNTDNAAYSSNVINESDWNTNFESRGAIFLPITGMRKGTIVGVSEGLYWSASYNTNKNAYRLFFQDNSLSAETTGNRSIGISVRLVHDY